MLEALAPSLGTPARAFLDALRAGGYDGNLDACTAVRIASLLRYALGIVPLDLYEIDHGKVGTPAALVDDLTVALTAGIDELTRTIDTIKHQAKTVTVGISRSDEELLQVPLVRTVLGTGASRDALSYRSLRTLVALDPGVVEVLGYTRYRVEGDLGVRRRHAARRRHHGRLPVAHGRRPDAAGHEAPRGDAARGHRRPRAQRRPHGAASCPR